ncbi:hypothetical protein BGZ81_006611 [Podila clonocystis]|nr:hypothetical protein BGZ81_006611 [Podila clonocystis]
MKKLAFILHQDKFYMPGDTITGNLTFNTSSSIKYTCIKIRFVGLVSTKLAKTSEEVYVLNQQAVVLGNPNNAEESVLPEGKHSWPFEFAVPLQHIPSSGKYRHGSVKYTLTALVTTKGFLGGVQELKVNKVVELKDLINCAQEPFSNSTVVTGSSNTKPATNKSKNLALATITLAKSAYLKGQAISINIDMSHPNTIQRNPGCWIQLIRMENYHAGEQSKEYSHVVASSTHAIEMDLKHGKILTELTVPEDSITTMSTTKIISIEYKLKILFDMRPRTGFFEGKNRRTVNKKLRAKITGKPGGFEVEVPVVIGTLLDSSHIPGSGTVSSLAISLPGIQPPEIPSPGSSIRTLEHLVSNMHMSSNSEGTPEALHPKMHQANHSAFHTIPIAHGRQASEPAFGLATIRGSSSQPVRHHTAHYIQQTAPSAPSAVSAPSSLEPKALPPLPLNAIPFHPPSPAMSPSSSSSSSSHPPSSSYEPPRLPYRANSESASSSPVSLTTPSGYPNEKLVTMPHQLIQSPNAHIVESPTAPQAVSLGLGPASPGILHRSAVASGTSSSSSYFQVIPSKQHSLPLSYGAFAISPVSISPNQGFPRQGYTPRTTYTQPHASTSTSQHNYAWSTSSSSSSGGSSSVVPRSPPFVPPPPPAPAVPRSQPAMEGRGSVPVIRPESFHPAPPYTPMA